MSRNDKNKNCRNAKPEFHVTIEYVPLPEELKRRTYREWGRLYLKSEMERLRREKRKESRADL